jgi:hypothetical protein
MTMRGLPTGSRRMEHQVAQAASILKRRSGPHRVVQALQALPNTWRCSMRSTFADAMSVALVLAASAPGAASARATEPESARAVWFPYDILVDLQNLPRRYSCDDLESKFRGVLLSIGARPDMTIVPYQCHSYSPRIHVLFSLPKTLEGYTELTAIDESVRLAPGRPASLTSSDCALVREMKNTLLADLPIRVISYRFTCIAPPSRYPPFQMTVHVLAPETSGERRIAHERGFRAGSRSSAPHPIHG